MHFFHSWYQNMFDMSQWNVSGKQFHLYRHRLNRPPGLSTWSESLCVSFASAAHVSCPSESILHSLGDDKDGLMGMSLGSRTIQESNLNWWPTSREPMAPFNGPAGLSCPIAAQALFPRTSLHQAFSKWVILLLPIFHPHKAWQLQKLANKIPSCLAHARLAGN